MSKILSIFPLVIIVILLSIAMFIVSLRGRLIIVLLTILLLFATNIFAQKRVEFQDVTLKNSVDIRPMPTVTMVEIEEHRTKLKLLKQGYDDSKIEACRGKRKHFITNHKRKNHKRHRRSSCGF